MGTPQHISDPDDQLSHAEWLGHIVVCAKLQPNYPVYLLALSGEHEYRNISLAAQYSTDLEAVELRKHDIKDNQVWLILSCKSKATFTVFGGIEVIALMLQVVPDGLKKVLGAWN